MRVRLVGVFGALYLLLTPFSLARQSVSDDSIVHGTINIALGNENGLVVLTDSMISVGGRPHPELPGQKLFKLDDRTVCAIAGFASGAAVSSKAAPTQRVIPDLNTSTSAIIHEYVSQSALQSPQSIAERTRALSFLMGIHLSALANVRDALDNPTPIDGYRFQLIVAGYDIDNKPKIGRITLRMKNDKGSFVSEIEEASISNVGDHLTWQLNGIPEIALQLLQHPESKPKDAALIEYSDSLRKDHGQSLTVDQMVDLARRLEYYTAQAHPEVGGPNQIAIFRKQPFVSIDQQKFPEPPRSVVNFSLVVVSKFSYSSIAIAKGVHTVFVRCSWTGMQRELDGNYFIANDFTKSFLLYDGGTVNLGDTNRVTDSVLVLGPHVKPGDDTIRRLAKSFAWSRIVRLVPKTTP